MWYLSFSLKGGLSRSEKANKRFLEVNKKYFRRKFYARNVITVRKHFFLLLLETRRKVKIKEN